MNYSEFLTTKKINILPTGINVANDINPNLFKWQQDIVSWSLKRGCSAMFEDCGLGKTAQQLEWANQMHQYTSEPVLILAPLSVSQQSIREGEKFGINVNSIELQSDIKNGINITNYEKLDKFDTSKFSSVVLDESSILKAYTGKTKRKICKSFENTPYKLACTATPAPNDLMELLNHAEFLGIMRSSEALSCWFIADQRHSGKYRLKGHAEKDFWQWVSSWAVCIEKPSDIGYLDDGYILPKLNEIDDILDTNSKNNTLESVNKKIDMSATGFHREKKKTLDIRVNRCAEIARNIQGQVVIWCYQNDESKALKKLLPDAIEVKGSDKAEVKEKAAVDFINGDKKILISKPSIFGYGLNFQNCHNSIFCGLDYSYESYYQAVRRFYRFGQKNEVNVYRVLGDTEKTILDTIERKAKQKSDMAVSMAQAMKDYQIHAVHGRKFKLDLQEQTVVFPQWLRSEIA